MSQERTKNKPKVDRKPVFVRGIQPSTKEWLQGKVDDDSPSIPRVVKKIVEDQHRREIEEKRRR